MPPPPPQKKVVAWPPPSNSSSATVSTNNNINNDKPIPPSQKNPPPFNPQNKTQPAVNKFPQKNESSIPNKVPPQPPKDNNSKLPPGKKLPAKTQPPPMRTVGQEEEKQESKSKFQQLQNNLNQSQVLVPRNNQNNNESSAKRKPIAASKAARQAGRNEEAIKVNLDSIRNKPKFGRLVIYSVNCLANLAENRFNCESIVEQGGIQICKEVLKNHKGNPGVMKEAARMLTNIARASPEYAKMIASEGLLELALDILKENPEECGVYALQIIDSVLKNVEDPQAIAEKLLKLGGLDILKNALSKYINNPELASAIINTLNVLTNTSRDIGKIIGNQQLYKQILDALKMHPHDGNLAINATRALASLAKLDPKFLQGMRDYDAVPIISNAMQANPDLDLLVKEGAAALQLLAGQDDLSKALNVLLHYNQYDNKLISQALGLLGNLALITDNANFIVGNGGIKGLIDFINFKSKGGKLTPEDEKMLADAIRALGRLLTDEGRAEEFYKQKGMDVLKQMLQVHNNSEPIMNAVMDALLNLSQNSTGQKAIIDSNILADCTDVLAKHPDYEVMMRKYADLLAALPLEDRKVLQPLIDAGLLEVITKCLLANYENPESTIATFDLMKAISAAAPHLTSGLVHDNAKGIVQAIKANANNIDVLKHIFSALTTLAGNDPSALAVLKQAGLEQELVRILKQDNVSDQVLAEVKGFYDSLINDGVECDFSQLLASLQSLGIPLDNHDQFSSQVQTREHSGSKWSDPSVVIQGLKEIASLLDDPNYAKQFVTSGQVTNILDNIQQYYTDPNVIIPGLEALVRCAAVPGVFAKLEEEGVPEAVIQCMLEHPDNKLVQLAAMKVLAALASAKDPLVIESLCQPITLDTAIKALNNNLSDPNLVMAFADFINNLLSDPNTGPQVSSALISEGIMDALHIGMDKFKGNPQVLLKCKTALSKLEQYSGMSPIIGQHGAQIGPAVNMGNLAKLSPDQLNELMKNYDVDELLTTFKASKDAKITESSAKEINDRLNGGDEETYSSVVGKGGITDLLSQAGNNMDNSNALGACLDALGTLSTDDRLKTLLGMHGVIRLILECIRRHPNDIELLDKCCYILSNLSFNNGQNMTAIIELGGVSDIVDVLKKHKPINFLCESSINVLCNLCHNSDKNKILITSAGGSGATVQALKQHGRCTQEGDAEVCVAGFRALANLGYVSDNVKQLVKEGAVPVVMDVTSNNINNLDLVQMGIVVLANLSSHEKVAAEMVKLGVLDLIIRISEGFPDIIELQRSCLGCIGNLMNDPSNAISFLDKKGHKRLFAIMEDLGFEDSVLTLTLQLLKVLATNADIATHLTEEGACKYVSQVILDNKSNSVLVSLACQALCKLIVTVEAAKQVAKEQLYETLITICNEPDTYRDLTIMNELIKVVVNFSSIEENAQPFARNGSITLLKAIEAHYDNPIFLNNAAMALSKLSVHPTASRHLVKRGIVAVLLDSLQKNKERRGIITRYIRTLTNLLYTEHKTSDEIVNLNGIDIINNIINQHLDYQPLQQEYSNFDKAIKLKSKKLGPSSNSVSIPVRDRMNMANVRLLCSGTIMKKHGDGDKAKKKLIKANDDCTLLLFEDPNGKKAPKQLNMKSVKEIRSGNNTKGLNKLPPDVTFAIISLDPNGREFLIELECKSAVETQRWVEALLDLLNANQQPGVSSLPLPNEADDM